ncbi:MAG: hypothetical protein QNI85_15695, partial [Desulfobacterales bacterium]|nr:hypothetical protein [Desulfobacterales bacterium]
MSLVWDGAGRAAPQFGVRRLLIQTEVPGVHLLINDLSEMCFRHMPVDSFSSIAWNLWHITRIEDAVGNILIADESQIFNSALKKRMGASLMDTGNAMDLKEATAFSKTIKMNELLIYRFKVGEKSQK